MNHATVMSTAAVLAATITAPAVAQSVAQYRFVFGQSLPSPGDVISVAVFGEALSGQIGNNSGIGGVNLSVDLTGVTLLADTIQPNRDTFGQANIVLDAEGFDIAIQANSFAGDNFDGDTPLLTFDVSFDRIAPIIIDGSPGTVAGFGAAAGIPGPFQGSVDYDTVLFQRFELVIPTPGTAATFGFAGLTIARRRRA